MINNNNKQSWKAFRLREEFIVINTTIGALAILSIAILTSISLISLLRQVQAQEQDFGVETGEGTAGADKMLAAINYNDNPVNLTKNQKVIITVTAVDANTFKPIKDATVAITVDTYGNYYSSSYTYTNTTNADGQIVYTVPLLPTEENKNNNTALLGDYLTSIDVVKPIYEPVSDYIHFLVVS